MNDQKSAEAIGQQLASVVSPETLPHLKSALKKVSDEDLPSLMRKSVKAPEISTFICPQADKCGAAC